MKTWATDSNRRHPPRGVDEVYDLSHGELLAADGVSSSRAPERNENAALHILRLLTYKKAAKVIASIAPVMTGQ
jgi:hypothetical protein